jgi:hypothetical protein
LRNHRRRILSRRLRYSLPPPLSTRTFREPRRRRTRHTPVTRKIRSSNPCVLHDTVHAPSSTRKEDDLAENAMHQARHDPSSHASPRTPPITLRAPTSKSHDFLYRKPPSHQTLYSALIHPCIDSAIVTVHDRQPILHRYGLRENLSRQAAARVYIFKASFLFLPRRSACMRG